MEQQCWFTPVHCQPCSPHCLLVLPVLIYSPRSLKHIGHTCQTQCWNAMLKSYELDLQYAPLHPFMSSLFFVPPSLPPPLLHFAAVAVEVRQLWRNVVVDPRAGEGLLLVSLPRPEECIQPWRVWNEMFTFLCLPIKPVNIALYLMQM